MRTFKQNLAAVIIALLAVCCMAGTARADDQSEQYLVTIKTYIISGSAGPSGLSFPVFPNMSLAVLEQTIPKVEIFYDKLKALYAFSDYQLLDVASGTVRLTGYPRPTAAQTTVDHRAQSGPWRVDWQNFTWDKEGRLQMTVKVEKAGEPFIESHISVLPGRSVILGRFADQQMKEAIFAIIVPEIDVAAVPEKDMMGSSARIMAEQEIPMEKKAGLPPVAAQEKGQAQKKGSTILCTNDADSTLNKFIAVSRYPELLVQKLPEYPATAIDERAEGKVWVNSLISKEGKVLKTCVLRSSGRDDLDQAAIDAAGDYEYTPALDENGMPVTIWVAFQIVFKLNE